MQSGLRWPPPQFPVRRMAHPTSCPLTARTGNATAWCIMVKQVAMVKVTDLAWCRDELAVTDGAYTPPAARVGLAYGAASPSAGSDSRHVHERPPLNQAVHWAWFIAEDSHDANTLTAADATWDEAGKCALVADEMHLDHGHRFFEASCICNPKRIIAIKEVLNQALRKVPRAARLANTISCASNEAMLGRYNKCRCNILNA